MPAQADLTPKLTAADVNELMRSVYPQLNDGHVAYEALDVFPGGCTVRLNATAGRAAPYPAPRCSRWPT